MYATFRNYSGQPLFTDDYRKVRNFLIRINREELTTPNFTWGRWEWMTTHSMLDQTALGKIGLWESDGEIVGLTTYESTLGYGYFFVAEGFEYLKPEMLDYACKELSKDGKFRALIYNNDRTFQRVAFSRGFRPTQDGEHIAAIDIDECLTYTLPAGFKIVSMADGWDFYQYNRVMWWGFNHEGEAPDYIESRKKMLSSPTIIPELVLAVVAPDGNYVSHCGMLYARRQSALFVSKQLFL